MSIATERPDELIEILRTDLQDRLGFVIIQDQKTSGTSGGTFTSGAWRTRDLNTTILNTVGDNYSLAANQFTLPKGVYLIYGSACANRVNRHHTRLYNVTDAAVIITVEGSSEFSSSGDGTNNRSVFSGYFVITSSKVFEVQHRCQTTIATYGYGVGSGASFAVQKEMYTEIMICKIG